MDFFITLFKNAGAQTLVSLSHNWPYLLASILIAAALKAFVDANRVSVFLQRFRGAGVFAATGAAVATPFCSCGTTAVVLGMMASTMPMAPIIAFMIASPLSSPEGLFYSAGLFGWPFAISYFVAAVILGLAGGGLAAILEKRGLLRNQVRFSPSEKTGKKAEGKAGLMKESPCACSAEAAVPSCACSAKPVVPSCACSAKPAALPATDTAPRASPSPTRILTLLRAAAEVSKKLLPMFIGFAFLGYLLNSLIPASWISALFGKGHAYSVPLAATIGLPLYVSSEASLPLVRALLDSGMSQGAIMAFLIAGSGTSIGAITGALTIARWKVVGIVVAVLWVGAILAGYGFDILVAAGLA